MIVAFIEFLENWYQKHEANCRIQITYLYLRRLISKYTCIIPIYKQVLAVTQELKRTT